jgi:hypothetical protein
MSKLSVMSRFPEIGKVILLSFPRYKGDFIQQRFFNSRDKNEPKTWSIKAATWEVNPTIHRHQLESEYIRNPIEARARFECEPPNMEDAYFRDPDLVRKSFLHAENPLNDEINEAVCATATSTRWDTASVACSTAAATTISA